MERRLLVIQEHNAKKAGLHWDVRFEDGGDITTYLNKRTSDSPEPMPSKDCHVCSGTGVDPARPLETCGWCHGDNKVKVLKSYVIPKHEFPTEKGKVKMVIHVEDHPWDYRNFEGTIAAGYGAGDVKLLFCDYINVETFTEDKITFEFKDHWYTIFNAGKNFLIKLNS